jgi:hypothetical protein
MPVKYKYEPRKDGDNWYAFNNFIFYSIFILILITIASFISQNIIIGIIFGVIVYLGIKDIKDENDE